MKGLTATEKLVVLRTRLAKARNERITRYDLENELEISMDTLKKLLPGLRRKNLIGEVKRGEIYATDESAPGAP